MGQYFCRLGEGKLIVNAWPSNQVIREVNLVGRITPFWRSLAFLPNSTVVALGGHDGALALWDVEKNKEVWTTKKENAHSSKVWSIVPSLDGSRVVSCGVDWNLKVWSTTSGDLLQTLSGHSNSVLDAAFSPDGQTLASCSLDGYVILWDVESWEQRFTFPGDRAGFQCIAFTADGNTLIAGDTRGRLWYWRR
jgi:WD40 repeat protein